MLPEGWAVKWEQHYKRGDYAKLSALTGLSGIINYIHNADIPPQALKILTEYYQQKETEAANL